MFKKNQNRVFGQNPYGGFSQNQFMNQPPGGEFDPNQNQMYPGFQFERLEYELKETRRRMNNLSKRITRIENYLRIRDDTDYESINNDIPNVFYDK